MRPLICTALISASLVAGCTTGISTPRQGVAACYSSVSAVANSAADLDLRGQLPPTTKAKVKDAATQALASCDAAKVALAAGDVKTAEGALKAAEVLLLTIEANLKGK